MKKSIFSIIFILGTIILQAQTWINPLTLTGEWDAYGIGDPYIMKYRGTYYLYCSTKDNNIGVKCWSSKDLINWTGPYMCSTDAITKTAYAPEVIYWNGMFYMYTSPAGGGHYVLSSTSPTGPFTLVTANLGKSIDGSVFINDDGNWYFYHAGGSGILGCSMTNPTTIGGDVNLNACIGNSWTEGPCVFKRNGIYYLLYTGNHVISKGYRVDYAKNATNPIGSFTPQNAQNPILLKSEGSVVGLGHGTAFIGPDLDSYYFCYHNLASNVGPFRHLNLDRIAWNGDKLLMLGPTVWGQQAPQMPDIYDYFERNDLGTDWLLPNGGDWAIRNQEMLSQNQTSLGTDTAFKCIHSQPTNSSYTAEFNLKEDQSEGNNSAFGAIFGYSDDNNYGIAALHSHSNKMEVNFKTNGNWRTPQLINLPSNYIYSAWHNIRIEKNSNIYKIYIDGMLKYSTNSELTGGKIGYMTSRCKASFGFIAFTNQVDGSGIFDVYKPIPGCIQAVHYKDGGEGIGYHDSSAGNSGGKYHRNDNVDIDDCPEGGYAIINNQNGEWYSYNTNIKMSATYNLGLRYASLGTGSQIRIWQGDTDLTGVVDLPSTAGNNIWQTFTIKGLNLTKGKQTLRVEVIAGGFSFYEMNFVDAQNTDISVFDNFDTTFSTAWYYSDGIWSNESGEANISGYGKRTIGNTGWTDYIVQTDITYYDVLNAGLIFRVNNPALGGAGNNSTLGTNFYQGYYVTLSSNAVILGKQNYNWTQLTSSPGAYTTNKKYTLRVVISGPNIKVYVDNMIVPKIDYTDTNPFIAGKVGLRTFNAHVHFDNFSVTSLNLNPNSITTLSKADAIELSPNPVTNMLSIKNTSDFSKLLIYDVEGKLIYCNKIFGNICDVSTTHFKKGLYLVRLENKLLQTVSKKFIKN